MKILLVNTYDRGGAANACIRLHHALLGAGFTSHLLTANKSRDDIPNHFSYVEFTGKTAGNILNRLAYVDIGDHGPYSTKEIKKISMAASEYTDVFSSIYSDYRIEDAPSISSYDIVNLHWTSRFLNWPSFFASTQIKQVAWSLHDMAPFTGGYHYSDGFEGYKGDDSSPHFLRHTSDPDFAKKLLSEKQHILAKCTIPVAVVSLSQWLHQCAQDSTLFKCYPIRRIPNSVDTKLFCYGDRLAARKSLKLPLDKKLILFVSETIANKRKGFHLLEAALANASSQEVMLCSVGKLTDNNPNFHNFGNIDDDEHLVDIYRAADLFVLPSLEDNLPNVVVEALCCGTPVVGFEIGGMPDMITNGENGWLSQEISANALWQSINCVFDTYKQYDRKQISEKAQRQYNYSQQAISFHHFVKSLLS